MREIQFRGKRVDTQEWTFGSLVNCHNGRMGIVSMTKYCEENGIEAIIDEVLPETVGQYVGIRDATGQKIYEGDIIRDWRGLREVKFEIFDNRQGYEIELEDSDLEVIGNIHDNPELLKGGQNV